MIVVIAHHFNYVIDPFFPSIELEMARKYNPTDENILHNKRLFEEIHHQKSKHRSRASISKMKRVHESDSVYDCGYDLKEHTENETSRSCRQKGNG